jgi:hypothetical protein
MPAGIDKTSANLHFIKGRDSAQGLAGFLQAFFGQTVSVPRKVGTATVISGQTTVTVVDAKILAGDLVFLQQKTAGANACTVTGIVITAATNFVITVNTDPGTGGVVFNYQVFRPVSS